MQKIVTTLWFDGRVQEAVDFYTSIFDHSRIVAISRYSEAGPGPKMEAMAGELEGFTVSGATIHFMPERPLPRELVVQIVRERMRE